MILILPGVIDETVRTIHLVIPYSQDASSLVASFTSSPYSSVLVGSTHQVSGTTPNNFTGPVTYYCRAEDGSVATYIVTVSHAEAITLNSLLTFRFNDLEPDVIGVIDQDSYSVTLHLPVSQSVNGLVASFTISPLAKAFIGGVLQTSGLTANNFTSPVTYSIRAENGSIRYYYINIVRDPVRTEHILESFSFQGLIPPSEGIVDQQTHQITVHVPFSTSVTALQASFTASYLATVKVGDTVQISGQTANNFTYGLNYRVFAEDGSSQNYSVNVVRDPVSSAKQITDFRFNGLAADAIGTIDEVAGTIIVTIPWSADINALPATFTNSPLSTVKVGSVLQMSGTTINQFSSPVIYVVTAENGQTKNYSIIVNRDAAATGNTILTFNFETQFNPPITGTIDNSAKTILLIVPYSCDVTGLIPSFTCSRSASLYFASTLQQSGVTPNNFSYPLTYSCRAEDGSTELYTVIVTHSPASNARNILDFRFNLANSVSIGAIDYVASTVKIHVPFGTDITYLVASFGLSPMARTDIGGILQVSGETPNDFSKPVIYRVVAEDNSESFFTVNVTVDPNNEKRLYSFEFKSLTPPVSGIINEALKTIQVNVPYSVSRNSLVATFTKSTNATVKAGTNDQTSGVTANNFSSTVAYTVFAQDYTTSNNNKQIYTVTVTNDPPNSEAKITDFRFNGLSSPSVGVINEQTGTISVVIPFAADITNLVAVFTNSPLSTVKIGNAGQTSGVTPNNFTLPLTYVVTAENGIVKNYAVTVVKAPAAIGKSFLSFNFEAQFDPDIIGLVDTLAKTIRLTVPLSQSVTSLRASFVTSPFSKVFIESVPQVSGVTSNDFTNPVIYKCVAEDGSINLYTVTVLHDRASSSKDILTFRFDGLLREAIGVIDQSRMTVTVRVPGETNVKSLVARFSLSPYAFARVGGATQVSGFTPNDFSDPVLFSVIAEDNSIKIYSILVFVGPNVEKKMLTFGFNDLGVAAAGVIDSIGKTIVVHVPFSASRSHLIATFTSSDKSTVWIGDSYQLSGNTANDFNYMRTYTVKAEDYSTQDYQVIVLKSAALSGNQITSFSFSEISLVACTIDQTARTIHVVLPFGSAHSSLTAIFTNSLFSAVSIDGIAQNSGLTTNDFSFPVVYRCTSESGLINEYIVSVTNESGSSEKAITYFAFEDLDPISVGEIDEISKVITIVVFDGTDISSLRATFENSPLSSVNIDGKGTQISGVNVNDYTYPVIYHVVAQNGSSVAYTVIVNVLPDTVPPIVINESQLLTNDTGQFAVLQSNEATGKVYLIRSDVPHETVADLERAVVAGSGRSATVTKANTDIDISTYTLEQGLYLTFAIDGPGNKSLPGINSITVMDVLAPDVFMRPQSISNAPSNFILAQSSENSGTIYLILEGVARYTLQQLEAAVGAHKGQKAAVSKANTDIQISTYQLFAGNYRAYAVDIHGNISTASVDFSIVNDASQLKSILSFSFDDINPPAVGQIVGSDIFVKVPAGTSFTSLVGYFSLSPEAKAFVGLVQQVSGTTPNDFSKMVTYTVEAEDGSTTDYYITVSIDTRIDDKLWFESIKAYPNPFTERLTIELSQPASTIQVVNVLNQAIEELSQPENNLIVLNTAVWAKGIYFIRFFRDSKYIGVQKVIRE